MSEGWVCPKCTRSWAPWVATCTCNNITVSTETQVMTAPLPPCEHVYGDATSQGACCIKCGQTRLVIRPTFTVTADPETAGTYAPVEPWGNTCRVSA